MATGLIRSVGRVSEGKETRPSPFSANEGAGNGVARRVGTLGSADPGDAVGTAEGTGRSLGRRLSTTKAACRRPDAVVSAMGGLTTCVSKATADGRPASAEPITTADAEASISTGVTVSTSRRGPATL